MLIEFDKMEETVLPKFQGGEPGCTIGLHTHGTSSEIIYILSGTGKVLYDGAYEPLTAGSCHYCPKGHAHSLINDSQGTLTFFAVVPNQS